MGKLDIYANDFEPKGADGDKGVQILVADPEVKTKRPSFFKVVLLNDDYTPMEFVVQLLRDIFRKSQEEGVRVMLEGQQQGGGNRRLKTREVTETKAQTVVGKATKQEYPLEWPN